jgi:2-polyprenyl-3-methyl-5-hydroxy-6-metoxy-1,4-benzoquinol methylase
MENFNYEDIFMGVREDKKRNYLRTFQDDYRLKRLVELLKLKKGKLLDIGCGGGITTESLSYYYPKVEIFGCDVSKQAIRYAKSFGSGRVEYSVIKNKRLPYKDNFFDACICLDVMEHIPDVNFFLKEVKRILKKNGKFFLLVPCEGQPFTHTWFSQLLKIGDKMTFKRYGHIHPEFTHKYVEELLGRHGFKIKEKAYSEHLIYQSISLLIYFIPRELMDLFLGKKANLYTDSGVIKYKKYESKDLIMHFRDLWFKFIRFLRVVTFWELELFKKVPFTAWKLITLAEVKK